MTDDDLEAALARYREARETAHERAAELADLDGSLDDLSSAFRSAIGLLDAYQDRATGSGDFKGYVEFRQRFDRLVNDLPDDLPHRDAFESAQSAVTHRRLGDEHFDQARQALDPVASVIETDRVRSEARDEARDARHDLLELRRNLEERRDELAALARLDPTAFDAPVDALREPLETYNEQVNADHDSFLRTTSMRAVLDVYERLDHFALLDLAAPPPALVSFAADHPIGDEPIPTVIEYLDYSRSKLAHYVDDPGRLLAEMRPHAPYLEQLTSRPFRLEWPPPERDVLRWRLRELHQAIDRFASESTAAALRRIEALVRDSDQFDYLRSAAVLQDELSPEQRRRIRSGDVDDELAAVERGIERIDTTLD